MKGKVKNFNKEKGYGFIKTEEGKDVFFHYSELKMEGFKTVENGIAPDNGQIGVEWLPLEQLMNYKLYPQQMRKHLLHYLEGKKVTTYLGDVN